MSCSYSLHIPNQIRLYLARIRRFTVTSAKCGINGGAWYFLVTARNENVHWRQQAPTATCSLSNLVLGFRGGRGRGSLVL